jgi:hypothetical protein
MTLSRRLAEVIKLCPGLAGYHRGYTAIKMEPNSYEFGANSPFWP